jgi:hypothetical protein
VTAGPPHRRARVRSPHAPPQDEEIRVYPGDALTLGSGSDSYPGWIRCTDASGCSSWIPEAYVRRRAGRGTVLTEYHSRELPARGGETVTVLRMLRGWAWVRAGDGQAGWLPLEKLDFEEDSTA